MSAMMDQTTKTTTTKPASSARTDVTQALRAATENGSAQAKEAFEKMSARTTEAASLVTNSYSMAVKGAQEYNNKALEFAQTNIEAAIGFTHNP
jgi:hypothetical protein